MFTFLFAAIFLLGFAQNNRISEFPFYGQDWDTPNEPNDCGPWSVGSILAYWNDHPYLCFSKFDRFINGSSDWNSNKANIRILIEDLKNELPYGYWMGDIYTNPNGIGDSLVRYCNDLSFSNNYNFVSKSIILSASNFQSAWELIKNEIDNGRPMLLVIAGQCDLYSQWVPKWETIPDLKHYMPIIGYDENLGGKKVVEVSYLLGDIIDSEHRHYINMETIIPNLYPTTIWTIEPDKKEIDPPGITDIQYTNDINTNIEITFNEKMNTSTLNSSNILVQSGSEPKSINIDFSKLPKLIITPVNLKYNEKVFVTLTTGIQNCEGDGLDGDKNGTVGPNYTFNFTTSSQVLLSVKVFLEGAYVGSGLMNTSLKARALVPLSQPYNISPWNYTGTETVASIPADVVDWVLVELRQAASPGLATSSTILAKRAAFLKSNGNIVDLDGTSPVLFNNSYVTEGNNLYIVVRHRNHLAIMSAFGAALSSGVYSYDFTTGLDKANGGRNGYKQVGSAFAMVSGDIDNDGNIFITDYDDFAIGFGASNGYFNSDLDMDGNTFVSDFDEWAVNFGLTVDNKLKSAHLKPEQGKSKFSSMVPE
jgi:hypothetical protein